MKIEVTTRMSIKGCKHTTQIELDDDTPKEDLEEIIKEVASGLMD